MPSNQDYPGAGPFVPGEDASLPAPAAAAQHCRGCDLQERATQTVFGAGPAQAEVLLIGAQPGDAEDRQVRACWPWLAAGISRLSPAVIVTLGATAGQAMFGSSFRITAHRGTRLDWHSPVLARQGRDSLTVVPTIHPSAILRADDRDAAFAGLVSDLRAAAQLLASR